MPTGTAGQLCKIASGTAVTKAFGGHIVIATAGTSGTGSRTCRYVLNATKIGRALIVQLSLTRHESRAVFAKVKRQAGNRGVSGVGQDAYYRAATRALQVYVRGVVVSVQASTEKPLGASAQAKLLTQQSALGRVIAAQQ